MTVQLWLRHEPKWKPGCGLFYSSSWEATYCSSMELTAVNVHVFVSTCVRLFSVLELNVYTVNVAFTEDLTLLHLPLTEIVFRSQCFLNM